MTAEVMNKQQYLDLLIETANAGKFPCGKFNEREGFVCKYRWRGRKCAAGLCISDERYDKSIEGYVVDSDDVTGRYDITLDTFDLLSCKNKRKVLIDAQMAHDFAVDGDCSFNKEAFIESLKESESFKDCRFPK